MNQTEVFETLNPSITDELSTPSTVDIIPPDEEEIDPPKSNSLLLEKTVAVNDYPLEQEGEILDRAKEPAPSQKENSSPNGKRKREPLISQGMPSAEPVINYANKIARDKKSLIELETFVATLTQSLTQDQSTMDDLSKTVERQRDKLKLLNQENKVWSDQIINWENLIQETKKKLESNLKILELAQEQELGLLKQMEKLRNQTKEKRSTVETLKTKMEKLKQDIASSSISLSAIKKKEDGFVLFDEDDEKEIAKSHSGPLKKVKINPPLAMRSVPLPEPVLPSDKIRNKVMKKESSIVTTGITTQEKCELQVPEIEKEGQEKNGKKDFIDSVVKDLEQFGQTFVESHPENAKSSLKTKSPLTSSVTPSSVEPLVEMGGVLISRRDLLLPSSQLESLSESLIPLSAFMNSTVTEERIGQSIPIHSSDTAMNKQKAKFKPYKSVLSSFRSLSPNTKVEHPTVGQREVHLDKTLCRFEMVGDVCMDSDCKGQHLKDLANDRKLILYNCLVLADTFKNEYVQMNK